MTSLENIHRHLDQIVIKSPEVTALVARYADFYKQDDRTVATLLQTLAEQDPFFASLRPDELKETLATYKMPLAK